MKMREITANRLLSLLLMISIGTNKTKLELEEFNHQAVRESFQKISLVEITINSIKIPAQNKIRQSSI